MTSEENIGADELAAECQQTINEIVGSRPEITTDRLQELAALSAVEYDRRRRASAQTLGIRTETLDKEVAALRPKDATPKEAGLIILAQPEPWECPVDGAELLDNILVTFEKYIVLPALAPIMLALWVLHTFVLDAADVSPILFVSSPLPRCGKTGLLEVLQALTYRPLPAANITPAAVFRTIQRYHPTLLIDEADTFLRDNEELRGVINSGHRKPSAVIIRTVGDDHEPKTFSTWCPKVIAAIGSVPVTIEDRSIKVAMRRKTKADRVERLRFGILTTETASLPRKAARWAVDNMPTLAYIDPPIPVGLHDRAADNWRPLLTIADLVGGTWPNRARSAALALSPTERDEQSAAIQLLEDIRRIFADQNAAKLFSETIVTELAKLEDRPWPEWKHGKPLSKTQLARLLNSFDIIPKSVRIEGHVAKGYDSDQFTDAFDRYLNNLSSEDVTPLQPTPGSTCTVSATVTPESIVTTSETAQPTSAVPCNEVTAPTKTTVVEWI